MSDAVHPYAVLTRSRAFNSDGELLRISKVFTQRTTSADEVLAAFAVVANSNADLVWFSFSGHALISGAGELRLLLPEWRRDDDADQQRRRSIGVRDLETVMRPHLATKNFVLVLDTCFSGAFGGDEVMRDIDSVEARVTCAGAVVISACTRDQVASDGCGDRPMNGAFTNALMEVLCDRLDTGASLTVFELFLETKRKIKNGQQPTFYANGLTDDFAILEGEGGAGKSNDIRRASFEVPVMLESILTSFLNSVVRIQRSGWVGLPQAARALERIAGDFDRYNRPAFVVCGTNANVVEVYDRACDFIVGCTTPSYFEEWHRSGIALLRANEQFIQRGGRVTRLFFVRNERYRRFGGAAKMIRDHVKAGIQVVIVHVDSFDPTVLMAVFPNANPKDLSSLECAFVDGRVFLKTRFIAEGDSEIEIDQGSDRCQHEYKAKLLPFLKSGHGQLVGASLDPGNRDKVVFSLLHQADVDQLRGQLERDLGIRNRDEWPARFARHGS